MKSLFRLIPTLCLMCFLTLSYQGIAQEDEVVWLPEPSAKKKWRPLVGFDSHRSFFKGRNVGFIGLRFGAQHKLVHRFGFGTYGMRKYEESYAEVSKEYPEIPYGKDVEFDVQFVSLFYERVVMQAGPWELSAPISLGGGRLIGEYEDDFGVEQNFVDKGFSTIGTGATLKFKFKPWLVPGVGCGFRWVYNSSPGVRKTMQQPYYSFRVQILLGEVVKALMK